MIVAVDWEAVQGVRAVIHLTNERSMRMSPSEVDTPNDVGDNTPQAIRVQGAVSHADDAGLPDRT